jgi:hypothetical protein
MSVPPDAGLKHFVLGAALRAFRLKAQTFGLKHHPNTDPEPAGTVARPTYQPGAAYLSCRVGHRADRRPGTSDQ